MNKFFDPVFWRDLRREWNYCSPSKYGSGMLIPIWQDWRWPHRSRPLMSRYLMLLLVVPHCITARSGYWRV